MQTPYRPLRALLAALGIALLLSALLVGRPPSARLFWAELYNLGHIPLFGFMGLLAIEVSRSLAGRVLARPRAHYAVALAVVALLSLVTELLQTDMPGREASLGDGLNNLLGGACFLGVRAAFDRLGIDLLPSYVMPDRMIRGSMPAFILRRYLMESR